MRRLLALVGLLLVLTITYSAREPAPPVPQDAYIWQRVWPPALLSAISGSKDIVSSWRVLVAETDERGTLVPVAVNWDALKATNRPLIAVIRVDGFLAHLDQAALLAEIGSLTEQWKTWAPLAGLEIDYDCATSKLAAYADFLARLREIPGIPKRLSITALPDWLASPDLTRVVSAADETVLQVHAVRAPREGLFDPDLARRWIDAFSDRTDKPFRVALPDYGARVVETDDGRIVAIESEMPRLLGAARSLGLMAKPADVAPLLYDLEARPPVHFAGIVWFRLPTDDDALTWSLPTWRAVIAQRDLATHLRAEAGTDAAPGAKSIVLSNVGDIDAMLPRAIALPADCHDVDGANGYAADHSMNKIVLHRLQSALLRAHRRQTIGWMRCASYRGDFDVEP
jgi:Protein of unknown function (DUF3142)